MGRKSKTDIYREGELTIEMQLTILIVLTARRWRSLMDDRLRRIDQSSARMEAMAAIHNSPPLSSQVDIANRLRIEGPTITRMIDTLAKDGLVERLAHPNDRRTKRLRLTDDGEQTLDGVLQIVANMRADLLEGFSEDELEGHLGFLQTLMDRLDDGLPDPDAKPQG